MTSISLLALSVLCYCLATGLVVGFIRSASDKQQPLHLLNKAIIVACVALACHLIYAYQNSQQDGMLNVSLSSMLILVSAILALIYQIGCMFMPIRRLGVLVYPLIVSCLAGSYFWQSNDSIEHVSTKLISAKLSIHVLISLSAYSLLTIATVQALLYVYQERQFKNRTKPLTLLSGAIFSQLLFGHAFEFKHHTILAILGWMVFGTLLFKRVKHGLRGSQAVAWTIAGFVLIQLGYFGTKFVAESLS